MNNLLHDQRDEDIDEPRDREITLGTTMVLAIFFSLAVLCAVFFGFGYSVGRKSAAAAGTAAPASVSFGGLKPSAGSPFSASAPSKPAPQQADVPYTPPAPATARPVVNQPVEDQPPALPEPRPREALPPATAATPVTPSPAAAGQSMVQIAAVSHQEDADLLVSTLKRRNYSVAVHQEPQDKLLHVQVGPFATRKDAEAMRQRLLADGFNAIVKDAPKQ